MLVRAVAALMLRTERGPLRPLWRALHLGVARALGAWLGGSLYLRGSFASPDRREPVYGLSDVDLVVVAVNVAARDRAARRWARIAPALPAIAVKAYAQDELADAAANDVLRAPRALFSGDHPHNRSFLLRTRPNLGGPAADWRLLAGRERRPAPAPTLDRAVVAWLELQCWWRYACWACVNPADRQVPYLCVKLVAEAARTWIWLVHGEAAHGRLHALERALRLMPDDEPTLRRTLALRGRLTRPAPLDETIAWLLDFSSRLSAAVCDRLEWDEPIAVAPAATNGGGVLPLTDWRAEVMGEGGTYTLREPSGGWPASIADAARAEASGEWVGLRAPGLLLLPSADLAARPFPRGTLRVVQCPASDPVAFALLEGRATARFPRAAGWSAEDRARRAALERPPRVARNR